VLDVGKSSVRLCAVDDRGVAMATLERPGAVDASPPYPHFDTDELYAWLLGGLKTFAREFEVHSVVPVTHGACAALIGEQGLLLPIMDYEFDGIDGLDAEYDALARDFARTASPRLPAGLNLGRQLFWQQRNFPDAFARAAIVPYPQYWAWRLCGVRAWEATSLGCHTDLWDPHADDFSPLAKTMRWDTLFDRRANAWTTLGTVTAEVAAATGLSRSCAVLAGIHDSNASWLAHRATREDSFAVVSTGTWIVVMTNGGSLDALREELDMLANVDAFGSPVPTARFMGGREYAAICGEDGLRAEPSAADLATVLAAGTLAIPSFADQGGAFRAHRGRVEGPTPETPRQRAALAALYCALMTDFCLELIDPEARGDVIVEGRLSSNEAFTSALAAMRAPHPVLRSADETGTLRGAATLSLLARGLRPHPAALSPCRAGSIDQLNSVRRAWRARLPITQ
jgi:L-fuculokinase